jgi:FtsH-binding integral membrane protein
MRDSLRLFKTRCVLSCNPNYLGYRLIPLQAALRPECSGNGAEHRLKRFAYRVFNYQESIMDRFSQSDPIIQARSGLQTYMAQVYGWMTCGLLLTAFVAWYASHSIAFLQLLSGNRFFFFGLVIAQLGVVIVLSALIQRLSAGAATALFMLYSVLTGLTLCSIFLIYTASSIAGTFVVTAGMFGAMSLWGYTTKRDLSGWGNMLFMALIGILLASLVNFWLKSEALMWVVTYVGVVVFVGLTAYDTQKLKAIGQQVDPRDATALRKYSIFGALTLYLDFINLFLMLLRIFGNRR